MPGHSIALKSCPKCGYQASTDQSVVPNFYRPWHLRGPGSVFRYVQSLGSEALEWMLALYVDGNLNLLAVDTVAQGSITACPVPFGSILFRAHELGAEGFVLVHNHPSGDPTPSMDDIRVTRRLAEISRDLDLPLLCHFVIAGGEMRTVGYW